MSNSAFDGIKVFSATKRIERDELGDTATRWLKNHDVQVVDTVIRQSSDSEYHCLSIIVFYQDNSR